MKNMLLATATVALVVLPHTVNAQNFNGPFVGLSLGHTWGDIEYNYEDGTTGFGDFSFDVDISGLEGGLFAGYRHRFPSNFVLGGEIGYQRSNADGSYSESSGGNTIELKFEKTEQLYVDFKPGYVFQDTILAYAIAGYQRSEFEAEALLNGTAFESADDKFDAWRFGAGLEYTVSDDFSIRGQYHYAMYDDADYSYDNGQTETLDSDENVITVGIAYNF